MIDNIELKNFRKFKHLPELNFSDINLFVGGNNAGKSTLSKAIILLLDNLKNMKGTSATNAYTGIHPSFLFSSKYHALHIGNFEKAFCKYGKSGEDMVFQFSIANGSYKIYVNKVADQSFVSKLIVSGSMDSEVIFDFKQGKVTIKELRDEKLSVKYTDQKKDLEKKIGNLTASLKNETNIEKVINRQEEIDKLQGNLKKVMGLLQYKPLDINVPLTLQINEVNKSLVLNLIESLNKYAETPIEGLRKNSKAYIEQKTNKDLLTQWLDDYFDPYYAILEKDIQSVDITYVPAHAASQKSVFSANDTSDFLSQTIHEFYGERIVAGDEEYDFVMRWLGKEGVGDAAGFGIADSFVINNIEDEAYTFTVVKDGESFPLASMGMGSVQIVILLLKLATIWRRAKNNSYTPLVFLEEPEQNLHPNWQSKLLDVFVDFRDSLREVEEIPYSPQMFIETHSEYLIRKAQVLVHDMNEDSSSNEIMTPCKVFYFPEDNEPYEMICRKDGKFANDFGEGFFDEASKLAFRIF